MLPRALFLALAVSALTVLTTLHPPGAGAAAAAPTCTPAALNTSAQLAGGVTVSPAPGSMDASYKTQISFLGLPAPDITVVSVVGSESGGHAGQLLAYSQGDGGSFVPSAPFTQGETVTVSADLTAASGTTPVSWSFTVADVDTVSRSLETPPPTPPAPKPGESQHFVSRPDLSPPTVTVSTHSSQASTEDIFLAPYAGTGQYGPMILDATGRLLWFKRLPPGARSADLRVQEDEGEPVMTWWQDPINWGGRTGAGVVIADSSYRELTVVRAGNGYQPDLHSFTITPQGTAFTTVYDAIRCNLSAEGGPANGAIADTVVQEIDLRTGLVRYEWHSLDHVPLSASYMPALPGSPRSPWDYFHINRIDPQANGDLLVDSRNTWAAYEVDGGTGQVLWQLGGKQSSVALGPGAAPAWQHDAEIQPNGTVTIFDNGATPKVHPQSRAIVLQLNLQAMSASLLSSFIHPDPALVVPSQGDMQALASGDWFVGWGQEPYFSEFNPAGRLLFDAHLPPSYQTYTVLRFPWNGSPLQPPSIAIRPASAGGVVLYLSWNGATAVSRWRVLGGSSSRSLRTLGTASRRGFETPLTLAGPARYLQAQALSATGQVLGHTALARG
jgi:hypothetical protein